MSDVQYFHFSWFDEQLSETHQILTAANEFEANVIASKFTLLHGDRGYQIEPLYVQPGVRHDA